MTDVAAKREARRRKILENSQNRLQRITGREEEPTIGDTLPRNTEDFFQQVFQNLQNNQIPNLNGHLHDNSLFEGRSDFREPLESNPAANDILNTLLNNINLNEEQPIQEISKFQLFLETKIHVILLSMIVYFIFAIKHENYLLGGSVFMPLYFWEIFELTFCRYKSSKPSLMASAIVLSGISPYKLKFITLCFKTIQHILTDSIIYTFIFVLSHLFWNNVLFDIRENNVTQTVGT